jgi:hypothetical protein
LSEFVCFLRREWRVVFPDGLKQAIAAPRRWVGGGEVNIGTTVFLAEAKVLVNVIENCVS